MQKLIDHTRALYEGFAAKHDVARKRLGRGLTYAEKVLFAHMENLEDSELQRGQTSIEYRPDRVALQDATAQMAILQFMSAGVDQVAVLTTVHCDHLIRARVGAREDLAVAADENSEVYEFLRTASARYGIGFWKPGSGIIHQVILESYALPGWMMLGTDSHTPNAGGLGMIAIGVGGADAVDVMVGEPWNLRMPKLIGVRLSGSLSGWTAPKDVILKVADILTVKGGTGCIVEYFGEGTRTISATGKATITNMGAEVGATTSIFPFDERSAVYLRTTRRGELADLAEEHAASLRADDEVASNADAYFDQIIDIDLSTLEPHIVGPHTPDLARPVSTMGADAKENDYPIEVGAALVGSCTNSSYEDIERAAHLARQAAEHGLRARAPLFISPGSEQVRATVERDGQLAALRAIGGTVLANACGPCIGQWHREGIEKGKKNSILTTFNRNFPKRNDGNPGTLAFIGSPETVIAYALAGTLDFNPLTDEIEAPSGKRVRLEVPEGKELPPGGFEQGEAGFVPPPAEGRSVEVAVAEGSERIERLVPFEPWDNKDLERLPLLVKARGKTTTDHISPAGPWLRFRGHLTNISKNMFISVDNAFGGDPGTGVNQRNGERDQLWKVAKAYRDEGLGWIAVGDWNWGEGSSREHAAMEPRFLGCRAILVRSFARIHETNLKKQGVLPLTFVNADDYERIRESDRISVVGLGNLAPGKPVTVIIHHDDGGEDRIEASHTLTPLQIEWFKAGSSLNVIAQRAAR